MLIFKEDITYREDHPDCTQVNLRVGVELFSEQCKEGL